jgi:hypothetical protein
VSYDETVLSQSKEFPSEKVFSSSRANFHLQKISIGDKHNYI